tara:strand:+ start:5433 stop:6428 length:996 start_codon:yes stop_codon:yes gene_type:complete
MGGNVFTGEAVESIPMEFIQPTLAAYYQELSVLFPQHSNFFKTFTTLGSVGKKSKSGDIDLAVDVKKLFPQGRITIEDLQSWNLNPALWRETYEKMLKRARTATPHEVSLRAFLYELSKYIGERSNLIKSDLKKVRPGQMFTLFPQITDFGQQMEVSVQIDWMLGDPEWLKFSYFSPMPSKTQPMLKGLHRTQLILAMFGAKGYAFRHVGGVFHKATGKKVAHSPSEASELLQKLYETPVTTQKLECFSTIYSFLASSCSNDDQNGAFDSYLCILDYTNGNKEVDPSSGEWRRCGYIPQELEEYWILNKERLGLKGRYLCKTANHRLRASL